MSTEQHWDARLYEAKHAFVWQQAASLLDLLAPQAGEHVLDLGCGTGHLTAEIAKPGATVIGIDNAPDMIAQARSNYPELPFELADARTLSFREQFDAVFSNAVLHWIPEAALVAASVARSLKRGGRFVAEFGGRGNVAAIVDAMRMAIRKLTGAEPGSPWYFPSIPEYAAVLERAGLETTFATLFERPTPLEGEAGIRHWVEMFGGPFLNQIATRHREEFLHLVEVQLRPRLFRHDGWFADYRRLRIKAVKI
jgi:trans-aconitate methyltransferase